MKLIRLLAFLWFFVGQPIYLLLPAGCAAPKPECGCELGNDGPAYAPKATDWVSVKSAGESIWTVGYYRRDGSWHGLQDCDNWEEAWRKAKELNARRGK